MCHRACHSVSCHAQSYMHQYNTTLGCVVIIIIIQDRSNFVPSNSLCCTTGTVVPLLRAAYGQGTGSIVEHIRCNGTENQLTECSIRDAYVLDGECTHSDDASVQCCELSYRHDHVRSIACIYCSLV